MNETAANQPAPYSPTELAATQRAIAPPPMRCNLVTRMSIQHYLKPTETRNRGRNPPPESWNVVQTASEYAAHSLAAEGFIHCAADAPKPWPPLGNTTYNRPQIPN